jgi:hypothetical protein
MVKLSELWQSLMDVKEEKVCLLAQQKRNIAALRAMNEFAALGLFDTTPDRPIQQDVAAVAADNAAYDTAFWRQGLAGVEPRTSIEPGEIVETDEHAEPVAGPSDEAAFDFSAFVSDPPVVVVPETPVTVPDN